MKPLPEVELVNESFCGRGPWTVYCNGYTVIDSPSVKVALANLELLLKSAEWPPEMEKEGAREMAAIVLAVLKEGVK